MTNSFMVLFYPFKRQPPKMVKNTQTIRWQLAEFCDCVWRWRLKGLQSFYFRTYLLKTDSDYFHLTDLKYRNAIIWNKNFRNVFINHIFADFILFKENIYCLFLQIEGVGDGGLQNCSYFVDAINVWLLKFLLSLRRPVFFQYSCSVLSLSWPLLFGMQFSSQL